MNIDQIVFFFAGIVIFLSVLLGILFNFNFLYFTLFVSGMMIQASITKLCPLGWFLKKLGFKTGKIFN
ncbi:MAG: YgaP-like transmembrane domain [Alphaproteobacteria bacterium]